MAETATSQLPPPEDAWYGDIMDFGNLKSVAAYLRIDDGGSGSGLALSVPEHGYGPSYRTDYEPGELSYMDPHSANLIMAPIGYGFAKSGSAPPWNLIWLTSPVSYLQHGVVRWGESTPAEMRSIFDVERAALHPAVYDFSQGLAGVMPTADVVNVASRVAAAAIQKTVSPEITVDVDGALSFDLRTSAGLLVLAELGLDGELDASVYGDDQDGLIKRLPRTTAAELIGWF